MFTAIGKKLKDIVIGKAKNPFHRSVFHNLSLIAFFAWVGLGADGLSSSVYGPAEAFLSLQHHKFLSIFVGLASVLTILVISGAYSQIIELFPSGGGGYLVASRLLSPYFGMVSGCALIVDYVLTIAISIASGADAIFSFLPAHLLHYKIAVGILGVGLLILVNLRGAKESVVPLVPIFMIFVVAHVFAILYAIFGHLGDVSAIGHGMRTDIHQTSAEIGLLGTFMVILHAYSMGAGTYTGIEAVSNGLAILREPKVKTGRRTMIYMAISLSFMVMGLLVAYLIMNVHPVNGKTLNAVLMGNLTASWPPYLSHAFILITLISEAAILFVAAQTGFFDGPRVIANMAIDRWFPTRFAMLSDRLITQNGILMMGISAILVILFTKGSVTFLIVLYSINVFITFVLSLLGMTRHWWNSRKKGASWKRKILVSGTGLVMCACILLTMVVLKFHDGGWLTILITGILIGFVVLIKRHYLQTALMLKKLDKMIVAAASDHFILTTPEARFDPNAKTAVLFVSGYTGMGLHTLSNVVGLFDGVFKNFVFVQVGLIDVAVFKGAEELENFQNRSAREVERYVELVKKYGYHAEGISTTAIDVVDEMAKISVRVLKQFPQAVFFGGKLVFTEDTFLTRWLHNSMVLSIQQRLYKKGIPFVILPVKVH